MKIAHLIWGISYGGIETMLVNIANAQACMGAEVHIVILNEVCEEGILNQFEENVRLHFIHRKLHSKGFRFAFKLNRLLRNIAPDAIHLHFSKLYLLLWHKSLRRIASLTLHAVPVGTVRRHSILSRMLPIADLLHTSKIAMIDSIPKVFSISQTVKDAWLHYGIDSVVVNNGILTRQFCRREVRTYDGKLHIVQVSRLEHDKKGQDLLIDAVEALRHKVTVDFIGDGISMNYLKQLVEEKQLQDDIHFLGNQTQAYIAAHLCKYDLFVQPSRWEGFGLTVAEAMAARLPVLVTEGQGPAEVTCGNQFGWTFKTGDAEDLAKQIHYIMEHYDEALSKVDEALHHVENTYDVSVTAKKYIDLY